jgi:hypothetical protein
MSPKNPAPGKRRTGQKISSRAVGPATISIRNTADYISEMAGELARLAQSSKLDLLASLLDVAQREASNALR